jgi:tRNA-specific 2-thiouridylase
VSDGSAAPVLVAMSGGVDSSVAAALMLRAGHEVVGATMVLWGGDSDTGCCSVSEVEDARRVCHQLGIDHVVFNFTDDFSRHVVDRYVDDHASGRTPNPCIECNRHLKFDRFLERAAALGFSRIATGHHARVVLRERRHALIRGADPQKDQSYVLSMLTQQELSRCEFPVGEMLKADVRAIAGDLGLRTATKPDSQDVCFVTRAHGRSGFLAPRLSFTPGRVVADTGEELSTVPAVELVTVGQRRGLGVPSHLRRYVTDIDRVNATVTVGSLARLRVGREALRLITWTHEPRWGACDVQVSAHGTPMAAEVVASGDGAQLIWKSPQRRVAPGQTVAFYSGDEVLGAALVADQLPAAP